MTFEPGTYAILTPDLTDVQDVRTFGAPFDAEEARVREVVITAPPAHDPATQKVVQTGWSINALSVNPVWSVVSLTAAELSLKDDDSEATLLHSAYQVFRDGTATNAQVQRAIAWLIKQEARRRGLI